MKFVSKFSLYNVSIFIKKIAYEIVICNMVTIGLSVIASEVLHTFVEYHFLIREIFIQICTVKQTNQKILWGMSLGGQCFGDLLGTLSHGQVSATFEDQTPNHI